MKDYGAPMHEGRFIQPYFKVYVYFEVSEPKLLIPYEDHLHSKNFDTINNGKQKTVWCYLMVLLNDSLNMAVVKVWTFLVSFYIGQTDKSVRSNDFVL